MTKLGDQIKQKQQQHSAAIKQKVQTKLAARPPAPHVKPGAKPAPKPAPAAAPAKAPALPADPAAASFNLDEQQRAQDRAALEQDLALQLANIQTLEGQTKEDLQKNLAIEARKHTDEIHAIDSAAAARGSFQSGGRLRQEDQSSAAYNDLISQLNTTSNRELLRLGDEAWKAQVAASQKKTSQGLQEQQAQLGEQQRKADAASGGSGGSGGGGGGGGRSRKKKGKVKPGASGTGGLYPAYGKPQRKGGLPVAGATEALKDPMSMGKNRSSPRYGDVVNELHNYVAQGGSHTVPAFMTHLRSLAKAAKKKANPNATDKELNAMVNDYMSQNQGAINQALLDEGF